MAVMDTNKILIANSPRTYRDSLQLQPIEMGI